MGPRLWPLAAPRAYCLNQSKDPISAEWSQHSMLAFERVRTTLVNQDALLKLKRLKFIFVESVFDNSIIKAINLP